MDDQKIKILLLEDDHDDAWLISNILKKENLQFEITLVDTEAKYVQQLKEFPPEIILSDHNLPSFSSTQALGILDNLGLNTPFILVTGAVSEEFAVAIMKCGADDYIIKDRLQRLPSAVLGILKRYKADKLCIEAEEKVKENEKKYISLIQHLPTNIALLNSEGTIIEVNNPWKLFAKENGYRGDNYGIGSNYIEVSRKKNKPDTNEGIFIAESIEKILCGELNDFSMIYPCHSPIKKRWFRVVVVRENDRYSSGIVIMHIDITQQYEAQLKAKQSEANLLSIFNNTDIAFLLLDTDLNIVSSNKMANLWANKAFGVNNLQGANLISLISKKKQKSSQIAMKQVLTGRSLDIEDSYILLDGTVKWFRLRMNDVTDDSGVVIGLCISAADITDRVLSQKKLKESEKRFQSLIEHSTDMKTLVTREGKMIYASPAITKQLGYSIEEFLNTPVNDLIFNKDLPDLINKIKELIKFPGQSFYSQHRLIHKRGHLIWCEGTLTNMFHEPTIRALVSNFRNITERKNLENLYQKTNKIARLGSWELDVKTNKLYWSEITKEIHEVDLDFEPDLETGINFYKDDENRNIITEAIKEATNSGKSWDVELQIITAKQNERWVRAIGEVEIKNGVCIRISGSFQDIDIRKKAEIERNRIANDLLKHSKNLEQFAYIVSHNLRAPVANILGLAKVLKSKITKADREKGQKYLFDAVSQMDEIIKDLNKILQIRSQSFEFKEPIYLPDLINDIQLSIQNVIQSECVKIVSTFSEVNTVTTIKSYLHSIFYNLIQNSIKFRRTGVAPTIEIKSELEKDKLRIVFKDNGLGIDLSQHGDKIFGLYKRFHFHVEGKGIGLFMTKTQIEVLGGNITVKSIPDKGTEFTIELPV